MKTKISIVTPSLNQGAYIEATIKSVVEQNYPNLEYIIADGASKDQTLSILEKYKQHFAKVISEKDTGHGDAINKGFANSTGEIMAWLNSDDKYYPWTFDVVSEIFEKFPDVDWIVGLNSWFDINGRLYQTAPIFKNKYNFLLSDYKWIQQESVFWRRRLWDKVGAKIDQSYSLMVDGDLWSRFFQHAELWHVNRVIGGYRVHDTNRAGLNGDKIIQEMDLIVSKMMGMLSPEDANRIAKLKKLDALGPKGRGLLKKLIRKPELMASAQHKCIAWHEGDWVKTSRPFFG